MVRIYRGDSEEIASGELVIEEVHPNHVDVFYIPDDSELEALGYDGDKPKLHILSIAGQNNYISLYPIEMHNLLNIFEPKHEKIQSITLDGFGFSVPKNSDEVLEILESLPSGFTKDYEHGLGLAYEYRFLIHAIEEMGDFEHLVISKTEETNIDKEKFFTLNFKHYDNLRKNINNTASRAQSAARRIKGITTYNMLAYFLDSPAIPQRTLQRSNNPFLNIISDPNRNDIPLSEGDQEIVIKMAVANTKAIVESQPEKLIKLRDEIELVTLEQLIEKFEATLDRRLTEAYWQQLFCDNPFILTLAFGYPVIKIKDQAHVGGRKFDGSGDKITDFLVKNSLSNNAALFEIKTPGTPLLNKTPQRSAIYSPSSALSGALNQMLDQRSQFQREVAMIKNNERLNNLESYAVQGVLVIGKTPIELDQQKSFELFRGNSKDVAIITFDELLEKLKALHSFLSAKADD